MINHLWVAQWLIQEEFKEITFRFTFRLEKKMANHSSILAWGIPWTEEPGRLQSCHCSLTRGHKESDTTEWISLVHSLTFRQIIKWLSDRTECTLVEFFEGDLGKEPSCQVGNEGLIFFSPRKEMWTEIVLWLHLSIWTYLERKVTAPRIQYIVIAQPVLLNCLIELSGNCQNWPFYF